MFTPASPTRDDLASATRPDPKAANDARRQRRLAVMIAAYNPALAADARAVIWMDQWLIGVGYKYRTAFAIEHAMVAFRETGQAT